MKKNLVAMLLAVGVIATAAGCGSTESTSTTSTTEYVTEETTTEETQVEETTEYVEETTEEVVEAAEEITVDELTVKVREAMEAVPYVVSDRIVITDSTGTDGGYNSYYNKEANTMYNECELNGTYWVDFSISTVYLLDASSNSYNLINDESTVQTLKGLALNIDDIYKTEEDSSAVCTLDSVVNNIATVTINNTTEDGNNYTAVVTINIETGLIESDYYTEVNESGEVVLEVKLNYSYPVEGTPEYDEFIQKTTIPAEAIEAANNQ